MVTSCAAGLECVSVLVKLHSVHTPPSLRELDVASGGRLLAQFRIATNGLTRLTQGNVFTPPLTINNANARYCLALWLTAQVVGSCMRSSQGVPQVWSARIEVRFKTFE